MATHWALQWLNQNENRAYPFVDWATRVCPDDATIVIPDDFLLALHLPVHAGTDAEPDKFFLKELVIYPTGYNITIGYDDGSSSPPTVAAANIPKSSHEEFRSYALAGVDDFDDSVGHVVIGKLTNIDQLPPGSYTFDRDSAGLEVDCVRPMIRGITSITVVNGSDRSEKIYGDVEFVAGQNMRIRTSLVAGETSQLIWDAIEGEGLNEECVCDEEAEGPCIRTVNGIPPYPDGNFRLVGDDCLEITPIDHGLQLEDNCSSPCCTCEELQPIINQIQRFADGVTTLNNFISRLQAEVTNMSSVILASKLGDTGCLECS